MIEAGNADQIMSVIPIQAESSRRQDEVGLALLHLVGRDDGRLRRIGLLLRQELEVMTADIEDAARGVVGEGDGHSALAGDETNVADRRIAKIAWKVPEESADASAGPGAEQAARGPVVFREKAAGALNDRFQLAHALGVLPAQAPT